MMEISRNYFSEALQNSNFSEEYKIAVLNYSAKLSSKNLPVIYSTKHLSLLLGIDYVELKRLIGKRERMYHFYQIKKRNGGTREISVPHSKLKYIQDWIKTRILDKVDSSKSAHGYIKTKSILTNASVHINSQAILNIDLKKFFDSVSESRVYHLFKHLGYHTNLCVDFAKLCTASISDMYYETFSEEDKELFKVFFENNTGVLPQGASTSPMLSNLICARLDKRLEAYAKKNNIQYSRYSDDLTFSGNISDLPSINILSKIIGDEKLFVNHQKIKLQTHGQRRRVTGLVVDVSVRIPMKFKKNIYRHLYFCEKFSPRVHFKYLSEKNNLEKGYAKEWLFGKIRYVYSVEPKEGIKMMNQFANLNWDI